MENWKMTVEQFGKIRKAEIEFAPLTLFVGDNNSGKSYLLSLSWAMRTIVKEFMFDLAFLKESPSDSFNMLFKLLGEKINNVTEEQPEFIEFSIIQPYLHSLINEAVECNKEKLIKALFNSDSVKIGKMSLLMPDNLSGAIKISIVENQIEFLYGEESAFIDLSYWKAKEEKDRNRDVVAAYILFLIWTLLGVEHISYESVYLPAARTGFMLTKDIINSYARKKTFDIEVNSVKNEPIQPFSRPIIEFLNVINDMSAEQKGNDQYKKLVAFIQNEMVQGNIEISALASKELSYIPKGQQQRYPFRTTSAVVTELSPLLLLLEHKEELPGVFYEEPELCLHPALQKKMGQLLIKMVNAGIDVTATTHSDIILQHINNMIRLQEQDMSELSYDDSDRISKDKVRVYQFTNLSDGTTDVTELKCGDNGFVVPTFNDALDEIMDETIMIQK